MEICGLILIQLSANPSTGVPKQVSRDGILICEGGISNYHRGNLNYHGRISNCLPSRQPPIRRKGGGRRELHRGASACGHPILEGSLWVGGWRLGGQGGVPLWQFKLAPWQFELPLCLQLILRLIGAPQRFVVLMILRLIGAPQRFVVLIK